MKITKRMLAITLVVFLAFGGLSLGASAATQTAARNASAFVAEIVRLVNVERANAGLPAVSNAHAQLNAAAQQRAVEIVTHFSHTRPDGSGWATILDEFEIFNFSGGENLAHGQTTPAEVMNGWMNSPGHRAIILGPDFNYLGIGIHESGGRIRWTQIFINDPLGTYAADTVQLINAARAEEGLVRLNTNANLTRAAQQRAVEVSTHFQNTRPNGAAWTTILAEFNVSASRQSINIVRGVLPAANLVNNLMGTSAGRNNILGDFNRVGVGVHLHEGELFFALIFIQTATTTPPTTATTQPTTTTTQTTTTRPPATTPNNILGTGWEATPLNWILFIVAFGWIWMWIF